MCVQIISEEVGPVVEKCDRQTPQLVLSTYECDFEEIITSCDTLSVEWIFSKLCFFLKKSPHYFIAVDFVCYHKLACKRAISSQ